MSEQHQETRSVAAKKEGVNPPQTDVNIGDVPIFEAACSALKDLERLEWEFQERCRTIAEKENEIVATQEGLEMLRIQHATDDESQVKAILEAQEALERMRIEQEKKEQAVERVIVDKQVDLEERLIEIEVCRQNLHEHVRKVRDQAFALLTSNLITLMPSTFENELRARIDQLKEDQSSEELMRAMTRLKDLIGLASMWFHETLINVPDPEIEEPEPVVQQQEVVREQQIEISTADIRRGDRDLSQTKKRMAKKEGGKERRSLSLIEEILQDQTPSIAYRPQRKKLERYDAQIRWLIRRDMPEVLEIEKASFESPWSEEDFLCCLRQRNCIGMVAEHDHRIVGFMIYELHKSKLHILNFAVAADARRHSVGNQMVLRLIDKLSQQRREEISLEVRERNIDAQMFFKTQGFRAVSVLRHHYDDTEEDAYILQFKLTVEEDSVSFSPKSRITEFFDK